MILILIGLKKLKEIHPLIGYSGHERGVAVTLAAVGLGAKVVERHLRLIEAWKGRIMLRV